MKNNWVRERIRSGKPTIGCFMGLGSPNVAELLAHAGFDWLVIETEHNGLDSAEVEHMLMAVNTTPTIPLVRIPSAQQTFIQRALDLGGMGIVVPMVRTAQEARQIVAATRYPPQGTRSFGGLRASHYTFDNEDYFNRANDQIIIMLIIETKEAAENLEEIAAVPGVDILFLGTMDLCLSLGLNPLRQPYPEISAILQKALEIRQRTGVTVGIGVTTPEQVRQRQAEGHHCLIYSGDYQMLAGAAQSGLAAFQRGPA
ncbi:MAG: aldolase/citrate lyase family protein [Terriglobia bacterium]